MWTESLWIAAGMAGSFMAAVLLILAYAIGRAVKKPELSPERFLAMPRPAGTVVVVAGASMTHGRIGCDWVAALRRRFPDRVFVNAGANGDLSWNVRQRLDEVIACRADRVILLVGANDAIGSFDRASGRVYRRKKDLPRLPGIDWFEENVRAILGRLRAESGARVAVLTLPPIGERPSAVTPVLDAHNEVLRSAAADSGVELLPVAGAFRDRLAAFESPGKEGEFRSGLRLAGRVLRAIVLHYVLGWSWDRVAGGRGGRLFVDSVHLSDRGGAILEETVARWLET